MLDSDTTIDNAIKTILKRYLLYITISQRIISEDYASKDLLIEINGNIKDIQEQIGYIK
ncbi:hypothetical protein IJM86_05420 [bacterium]|nr:hypothetical protein [bacterium]